MQTYKTAMFFSFLLLTLTGCASRHDQFTLRFHEQVSDVLPESRVHMVDVPSTGQRIAVDPFAQLSEKDVMEAHIEMTPGGSAVWLRFDLHGAMKLGELTTRIRGQHVVVFVNERPVACVLVDKRIDNGEFLLEGDLTDAEQQQLVDDLNKLAGRRRDAGDVQHAP
jgi:preprotein translocase subunit SecD